MADSAAVARATILIVDDDLGARELLWARLEPEGHRVELAEDGHEALEKARELMPDLILCDVMMPVMDGFEVCRRIRSDPRLAAVPIILVTALDDRESRIQGLKAGADDFVSKPYDGAELRARVRTITQLNRYRRLMAERAKFEWVVNQSEDGYLVLDDDRITYTNASARLYLGRTADDDPCGARFLELAAVQYHCEPAEAWELWPAPSPAPRYLVRPETATSKSFWLRVEILDLPGDSGAGRLVRLRDETAQVALHRDVWKFNALISHKLRTPMTVILGSLDLLGKDVSDHSKEEIVEVYEMAAKSARRLREQVTDVLDFVSGPDLAPSDKGFDLAALRDRIEAFGERLGVRSVTLENAVAESGCLAVSEIGFELILQELLGNAVKFHPEGSPAVTVALSSHDGEDGRPAVRLRVLDDGIHVPAESLARVWSPYFQSEKGFSGNVEGMGLGLSRVATLVWGVGGTCRMLNRPEGPGVVVELILPLA